MCKCLECETFQDNYPIKVIDIPSYPIWMMRFITLNVVLNALGLEILQ